ncbi:hypothetical protein CTZ27_30795 [Streptomyces griseocarneus]|nr:hypothetical protein CTZ27_30795 [Streptomyces griseocarneus]
MDIDGLSRRTLCEIVRLERTRNHLYPGDVGKAVRLWREFVRLPEGRQRHDAAYGNAHGDCCGDPMKGRALLDGVLLALSPRGARELREVIDALDARAHFP